MRQDQIFTPATAEERKPPRESWSSRGAKRASAVGEANPALAAILLVPSSSLCLLSLSLSLPPGYFSEGVLPASGFAAEKSWAESIACLRRIGSDWARGGWWEGEVLADDGGGLARGKEVCAYLLKRLFWRDIRRFRLLDFRPASSANQRPPAPRRARSAIPHRLSRRGGGRRQRGVNCVHLSGSKEREGRRNCGTVFGLSSFLPFFNVSETVVNDGRSMRSCCQTLANVAVCRDWWSY